MIIILKIHSIVSPSMRMLFSVYHQSLSWWGTCQISEHTPQNTGPQLLQARHSEWQHGQGSTSPSIIHMIPTGDARGRLQTQTSVISFTSAHSHSLIYTTWSRTLSGCLVLMPCLNNGVSHSDILFFEGACPLHRWWTSLALCPHGLCITIRKYTGT